MNDPREIEFGDDATALDRLYDTDGHLLYVGITFSPAGRMAHHAANQEWWGDVARKTMVWYPTRGRCLRSGGRGNSRRAPAAQQEAQQADTLALKPAQSRRVARTGSG